MKIIAEAAINKVTIGAKLRLTPIVFRLNKVAFSLKLVRYSIEFTNILVASATAVPINRPTEIISITSLHGFTILFNNWVVSFDESKIGELHSRLTFSLFK